MRLRSLGFVALAAAAVMQSCEPACAPEAAPPPVEVAPPPDISSVVVSGQGSGHGRGLSAWGAYGWATNGYTWDQILGYYYGGTLMGLSGNPRIGVRLLGHDGARNTAVISRSGRAIFNGVAFGAVWTEYQGNGVYNVAASAVPGCPGQPGVPWVPLGSVTGTANRPAVTFTTDVDETNSAPGDVLGLCQPDGSIVHYRGAISALFDGSGATRTVNDVAVENYLLGVVSREVSTSWGNAAGGRGMHALYAMAVASRSFALSQGRYAYARTCDSDACQVYGGAAYRANASAPTSWPRTQVCETGNPTFECANTTRAVRETGGSIRVWPNGSVVSTEYSASHGPASAGGPFPVVDDSMSNVPGNPNYRWSRTIDAATLEATYGLGNLVGASSERDPSSPYADVWGNRVVLQGTARTVVVANLDLRRAFGFPSHGFSIAGLNR